MVSPKQSNFKLSTIKIQLGKRGISKKIVEKFVEFVSQIRKNEPPLLIFLISILLKMTGKISKKRPSKNEKPRTITKQYSFFEDVYAVARQIPKGRVTSYGAIANYLGTKLSARMVGWAMNAASAAKPKVPAHRVVNRNGMLTGKAHFATPTLMEELLAKEKVKVEKDTVVNFKKLFWDPYEELGL